MRIYYSILYYKRMCVDKKDRNLNIKRRLFWYAIVCFCTQIQLFIVSIAFCRKSTKMFHVKPTFDISLHKFRRFKSTFIYYIYTIFLKGMVYMCEYGRRGNCKTCNDAIKEDGVVVGCLLEEKERQAEEEILRCYDTAD